MKKPKDYYEIEKIVNSRITQNGKREYLIKWKNYTSKHNTWEPISHLDKVQNLIKEYDRLHKLNKQTKITNYFKKKSLLQKQTKVQHSQQQFLSIDSHKPIKQENLFQINAPIQHQNQIHIQQSQIPHSNVQKNQENGHQNDEVQNQRSQTDFDQIEKKQQRKRRTVAQYKLYRNYKNMTRNASERISHILKKQKQQKQEVQIKDIKEQLQYYDQDQEFNILADARGLVVTLKHQQLQHEIQLSLIQKYNGRWLKDCFQSFI